MGRLEGKGAVVLGAANRGNMAQVIAQRFADEGARIVVAGRKLDELQRFAGELGGTALACDLTDPAQVTALARDAKAALGDVDIAVNATGWGLLKPFLDTTEDELQAMTALQFEGPFRFCQALVGVMATDRGGRGGAIIQISSATATIMLNDHAAYMGTKAGTDHVIRCVAHEFGSVGVRANSISPGLTDTPMTAGAKTVPGLFESFRAGYPLGRWGTSDDIAAAAVFLASDECFMTGENLQVNGGLTLRRNPTREEMAAAIAEASAGVSQRWDYVIVGAGSAGCVLAERLSADGRTSVLVLEAGGADTNPLIHMPKGMAKLVMNPKHTWFFPVAQPRVEGEPASELWVRGLGLGGSSSINGMIYVRGQPEDYAEWVERGATGWGWDTMKAAFRAIEDQALGDDGTRGSGGPVHVEPGRYRYPIAEALIAAGVEMGLPRHTDDLNREDQEGVGYYSHNIRRGRRQSAAVAFLRPAMKRANVRVITGATTDKVVFEHGRAVAVEALVNGERQRFDAGEVILAAGALMSPAILQRSGIGPADALRAAGIEPLIDSRDVGQRMRDHLGFALSYALKHDPGINRQFYGPRLIANTLRYYLTRTGPLATGPFEVGAFVKTTPDVERPDAQLYLGGFTFARSDDDNFPVPLADVERRPGATCYGQLLRLTSEGSVRVASADPTVLPEITPNWMTTPEDRASALAMIRYMRRYMAQPALADVIAEESFPGAQHDSDEDLFELFRRLSTCGTHAVATCRMGTDNAAVVDPDCRVKGVDSLRVVDCSAMPSLVSGNTNAPAMAFAWRAAERIKATARITA